jgi:uncharacterized protein (TIGR02265 family)
MRFVEPPWNEPIDAAAVIRSVPQNALIRGYMTMPMIAVAKGRDPAWTGPRERYLPFNFYSLREHVEIMVALARAVYPDLPLREALRKLGRGAPNALLTTTVGKVTMGAAAGVQNLVEAFASGYEVSVRPCTAQIVSHGSRHVIVSLATAPYFLDCHHVGAWEGVLKYAGVRGTVKICVTDETSANYLLEW